MVLVISNASFSTCFSSILYFTFLIFYCYYTLFLGLFCWRGTSKVTKARWGKGVVKELAAYIKAYDPTIGGFSDKNIWRMKQFYETYKEKQKLSPLVRELPQNTQGVFKDTYVLELLGLPKKHKEKDLQSAIVGSLKEFILELGVGFAFIGQEYRISVGDEDFYIDLLFSHRYLQCLVAFELKVDRFKASHLGQLEFYLEALDRDVKAPHENPSIGVLLCREKNDEVVEYALSRSLSPTVIADYETELIPKELLKQKVDELFRLYDEEDG
ncbi:MAG TPA: DUF1016 family protein [Campylobacterales bacterium]|nr:DUF1016 family protein [Campylobacterales bacterium]